jgi:hypothetical protein
MPPTQPERRHLLPCRSAQLALSARADGEASLAEAAVARLHTLTCPGCRAFASAIIGQREGLAMLVPARIAGGGGSHRAPGYAIRSRSGHHH